jgi:hypothetical protein
LFFFTGRYEVYRYFWFAYENLEGTATLELEPEQHNTTVWTDSRKEVNIKHRIVYGSDYTEPDLNGVLSPNKFRPSGPAK